VCRNGTDKSVATIAATARRSVPATKIRMPRMRSRCAHMHRTLSRRQLKNILQRTPEVNSPMHESPQVTQIRSPSRHNTNPSTLQHTEFCKRKSTSHARLKIPPAAEPVPARTTPKNGCVEIARSRIKTVGDCPNFAQSSEQNGTGTIRSGMVPLSETVLKTASTSAQKPREEFCAPVPVSLAPYGKKHCPMHF